MRLLVGDVGRATDIVAAFAALPTAYLLVSPDPGLLAVNGADRWPESVAVPAWDRSGR